MSRRGLKEEHNKEEKEQCKKEMENMYKKNKKMDSARNKLRICIKKKATSVQLKMNMKNNNTLSGL